MTHTITTSTTTQATRAAILDAGWEPASDSPRVYSRLLVLASAYLSVSGCLCLTTTRCARGQHFLLLPPIAVMLMCELSSLACDAVLLTGKLCPAEHSVAVHRYKQCVAHAVAQCRGAAAKA
jgi:hypothetical protein